MRSDRRQRSGTADDSRLDAGPVLRAYRRRAFRGSDARQCPSASGPYRVAEVQPGQRLVLRRDPDYWARDLPITRGLYNFDEIRIDYYRDATAMFEAFKAGPLRFSHRERPDALARRLRLPRRAGRTGAQARVSDRPSQGHVGFAFNTRRPMFADPRVREALAIMFDFEWINANLYGGVYRRSRSFFDDSELSSAGGPRRRGSARCSPPFPAPCARTSSRANGRRRSPTAPVATGRWRDGLERARKAAG